MMLKTATYVIAVEHMKQLGQLAKSKGTSASHLLRQAVADYLRRESRRAARKAASK
jgi:hypothetical protein